MDEIVKHAIYKCLLLFMIRDGGLAQGVCQEVGLIDQVVVIYCHIDGFVGEVEKKKRKKSRIYTTMRMRLSIH